MILFEVVFDPNKIKSEIENLKNFQQSENFYADLAKVKDVGRKLRVLEEKNGKIIEFEKALCDCDSFVEILEIEDDKDLFEELKSLLETLDAKLSELKIQTILNGKYDANNAIITLHSGAGGTEAQDWTEMLFRMYSMYAEKQKFKISILDSIDGDEAGLKSITFLVDGENAYGYLKAERGVHRLVRISPFDANSRRHTSFASVDVIPELEESPEIKISDDELKIDTFRASGAGGQHINKTDSAVRITHLPTGIVVSCQNERSQISNREQAMKVLLGKLAELQEREEMENLAKIRGNIKKIEWGSQIRSYVFQPYTMVKDHRTNFESSDIQSVMNGNIQEFIISYLSQLI